jgi:serine/threonine-protein kinase HipA
MKRKIEVDLALSAENSCHVGTMYVNQTRGGESSPFIYAQPWLENEQRFALDPHLPLIQGIQNPPAGMPLFGCFTDSAPDRWGRTLMQRWENHSARTEGRKPRAFADSDFLLGVNDPLRMGALRFREGSVYLAPATMGLPPLINFAKFYHTLNALQNGGHGKHLSDADIQDVIAPGSSLGGARPKATLCDGSGKLFLVKFPKDSDRLDLPLWEKVSLDLAAKCGIRTPHSTLEKLPDGKHCLIIERFDRGAGGNRIHFASAMTMLGSRDNDDTLYSYVDIASFMQAAGSHAGADLLELWTRMAFNVLTSNRDDHLRNHGFLREKTGWRLSPVYDLEPDSSKRAHSLALNENITEPDINIVLESVPYFDMEINEAKQIIARMVKILQTWKTHAKKMGAGQKDIEEMSNNFYSNGYF